MVSLSPAAPRASSWKERLAGAAFIYLVAWHVLFLFVYDAEPRGLETTGVQADSLAAYYVAALRSMPVPLANVHSEWWLPQHGAFLITVVSLVLWIRLDRSRA